MKKLAAVKNVRLPINGLSIDGSTARNPAEKLDPS